MAQHGSAITKKPTAKQLVERIAKDIEVMKAAFLDLIYESRATRRQAEEYWRHAETEKATLQFLLSNLEERRK